MNSSSDVGGSISDCGEKQDDTSPTQLTGGEPAEPLLAEVLLTGTDHQSPPGTSLQPPAYDSTRSSG